MRKVTYARLQTNAYAPGVGELKNTFPPSDKTLNDLEMWLTAGENLEMTFSYRGVKKHLHVPAANVAMVDLAITNEKNS
jgi:hypothetical protein